MALTPATKFWIGIGGYILTADMILWRRGNNSMSQEFGRWLQTPRGRATCLGGAAFLVGHLFLEMPIPGQTNLKRLATYQFKERGIK